ncbi:Ran-specific GTPase-activating protein 30 [Coemansia sp. RSA 2131]|nr:Ran-specific GTPase-activating protein 30 [Coemansia sp. RSA 2131]
MDELFSNLAIQTVQLVGKAAFGAAGTIALKRVTEYVHRVPHSSKRQPDVERLRSQFESKLRIITPAIDLIDIISARGHSTMSSVQQLTYSLRTDIVAFSAKLEAIDRLLDDSIIADLRMLLAKIDDAVPLLNLALTTSGAHLGSSLPSDVSPSRLMQASSLLSRADTWFDVKNKHEDVMVGEPFTLRMYSLFVGSVRPKSKLDFTWKEEFARCQVALWRVCMAHDSDAMISEFNYELCVVEDLNDGRYHDDTVGTDANNESARITDMAKHVDMRPGRVVRIPLDDIGGLHYTSAGSLLNIEDSNAPVLVISFENRKSGDITAVGSGLNISSVLPSLETTRTAWYALEVVTDDGKEPDISSASSESDEDNNECSESDEDNDECSESDQDSESDGARTGNALGVCDMESMGSGSNATTDSETSESEDAVSERDGSSGSEYSESEDSASEQHASSGSEPGSKSESEHSANSTKNNAKSRMHITDDIDKLADSIASLCTIDPSSIEHTPLPKAQTLHSIHAEAAEYFRPVEFLANEWRMCTLSLLEYMVRLASIEISEQTLHLNVPDEKLRLYLASKQGDVAQRVPGNALRSTPYRQSVSDMATPTYGRHRHTPSMLGSPAIRGHTAKIPSQYLKTPLNKK